MPDIAICNSGVCPVSKNCRLNWNSGIYRPDRDPKIQQWVHGPQEYRKTDPRSHDAFCDFYQPVDLAIAYADEKAARIMLQEAMKTMGASLEDRLFRARMTITAPSSVLADARKQQYARAAQQEQAERIRRREGMTA